MTSLVGIPSGEVDQVWDTVEPYIKEAVDYGTSRLTTADVYEKLILREYQLWTVNENQNIKSVVITEVFQTPRGTTASIFICTGSGMKDWLHHLSEIELWAKAQGCDIVEAFARPGWQRVLKDYKPRHVQLEKIL